MRFSLKIKNKVAIFILYFLLVESIINYIVKYIDAGGFVLTPYIRVLILLSTFLFFTLEIVNTKFPRFINKKTHQIDLFVYGWLVYSFVSILIGLINNNPKLYVLTDFIYIAFGSFIFFLSKKNNHIVFKDFNNFQVFNFLMVMLMILSLLFSYTPPSLLLIASAISIYINFLRSKYIVSILILIPYLVLVVTTNRSQLLVFLFLIFVLILKKVRTIYDNKAVIFYAILILISLYLMRNILFELVFLLINSKSNIGYRINQIAIILNEGFDFSNPFFVSVTQRVIEAEIVLKYWTSNLFNFIFGLGSGATIDGTKFFNDASVLSSSLLGANKVHNIHLLPFSLLFRYGFFGLILFVILLKIISKAFICVLNEEKNQNLIFWNMLIISWFIFSIPAASYLWTMPLFWVGLAQIQKE